MNIEKTIKRLTKLRREVSEIIEDLSGGIPTADRLQEILRLEASMQRDDPDYLLLLRGIQELAEGAPQSEALDTYCQVRDHLYSVSKNHFVSEKKRIAAKHGVRITDINRAIRYADIARVPAHWPTRKELRAKLGEMRQRNPDASVLEAFAQFDITADQLQIPAAHKYYDRGQRENGAR